MRKHYIDVNKVEIIKELVFCYKDIELILFKVIQHRLVIKYYTAVCAEGQSESLRSKVNKTTVGVKVSEYSVAMKRFKKMRKSIVEGTIKIVHK